MTAMGALVTTANTNAVGVSVAAVGAFVVSTVFGTLGLRLVGSTSDAVGLSVTPVGVAVGKVGGLLGKAVGGAEIGTPTHGTPVPKPHFGAAVVGSRLGDGVGAAVGGNVGGFDGASDASAVGGKGASVGKGDGAPDVGSRLGDSVGAAVGGNVGGFDGASSGSVVTGKGVGASEKTVGSIEGTALGPNDGASVGEGVGATVTVGGKVGSDGAVVEGTGVGLQTNKRFGLRKLSRQQRVRCGAHR